eukprot:2105561-Pleurochrysis_carterae.AAC.4
MPPLRDERSATQLHRVDATPLAELLVELCAGVRRGRVGRIGAGRGEAAHGGSVRDAKGASQRARRGGARATDPPPPPSFAVFT